MASTARAHLSPPDVARTLPAPALEQYVIPFQHATLEVGYYAPRGTDPQTPHTRDEVYVVITGRGTFVHSDTRRPFAPHDVLFVPAHATHRFENFTDDFATWVFFYGPEGGERV